MTGDQAKTSPCSILSSASLPTFAKTLIQTFPYIIRLPKLDYRKATDLCVTFLRLWSWTKLRIGMAVYSPVKWSSISILAVLPMPLSRIPKPEPNPSTLGSPRPKTGRSGGLPGKSWGRTNGFQRTVRLMGAHDSVLRFVWGSHQDLSTHSYPHYRRHRWPPFGDVFNFHLYHSYLLVALT